MKPRIQILCALLIAGCLLGPSQKAEAGGGSGGYELVDAVNNYRATRGLYALNAESHVMAAAQAHAEWIVATGQGGHTGAGGSDETIRVMWAGYGGGATIHCDEAWAETDSVESAVYNAWSDWTHQGVMLDYWGNGYTDAGGGVADDGNGMYVYVFDICVIRGKESKKAPTMVNTPADDSSGSFAVAPTLDTSQFIMSVKVAAPAADGSITHVVDYGQTLVQIALAYGVTVSDIRELNYMAEDDVTIYPEQKLLIRKKGHYNETAVPGTTGTPGTEVTPVETASTPMLAASFTPRVRPTRTALPVMALPSPTSTPTPVESSGGATQSVGIAMIVLCAIGLAAFLLFGVKKG